MESFRRSYRAAGGVLGDDRYWWLIDAVGFLPDPEKVAVPWRESGRADLTRLERDEASRSTSRGSCENRSADCSVVHLAAFAGSGLPIDLRLLAVVGGAAAELGLAEPLEPPRLTVLVGALPLVGQALALVGELLALVGDAIAFVGHAIAPVGVHLADRGLPLARIGIALAFVDFALALGGAFVSGVRSGSHHDQSLSATDPTEA